MLNTLKQF